MFYRREEREIMYVLVDLLVEIILAVPCSLADRSERLLVLEMFCCFLLSDYFVHLIYTSI